MPHYNETQLAIRDAVRNMVDKEIRPIASEIDATERFPEELTEIFGDMGLMQLWVPEKYGGPGGDLTTLCLVKEEIARVSQACSMFAGQNSIAGILPLLHFGTEEQRQRILPEIAKGRTLTAVAITEPHAGSDVSSISTSAIRDGDSYVLNGQKVFITFGSVAHKILVFAKTGDIARRGIDNISCFLVDTRTPGFSAGKGDKKMGMNGIPNCPIYLDNVRVPAEDMIGEEGAGFIAAMRILDINRPTVAATAVGLAQGALDVSLEYMKERKQFGRLIAEFQGLQFMVADMAMQVEAARELTYECTRLVDSGQLDNIAKMSSMAKCFASDMAMKVTTDAVQIFGGYGYMKDYPVERMMRDAKILQIYEGTNQIQRIVIARHLLDL